MYWNYYPTSRQGRLWCFRWQGQTRHWYIEWKKNSQLFHSQFNYSDFEKFEWKLEKGLKWMRKTSIKVRSLLYCRQKWHYHKYDVYSLNPILRATALTMGVVFLLKYSKYLFFLRQLMIQVDWYPNTWNCTFLFCKNLSNCKSIQSRNIWSNTSMIIL